MSSLENRKKELDGALSDALSVEFPFLICFPCCILLNTTNIAHYRRLQNNVRDSNLTSHKQLASLEGMLDLPNRVLQ